MSRRWCKHRSLLEEAQLTCPVHLSQGEGIVSVISWWNSLNSLSAPISGADLTKSVLKAASSFTLNEQLLLLQRLVKIKVQILCFIAHVIWVNLLVHSRILMKGNFQSLNLLSCGSEVEPVRSQPGLSLSHRFLRISHRFRCPQWELTFAMTCWAHAVFAVLQPQFTHG